MQSKLYHQSKRNNFHAKDEKAIKGYLKTNGLKMLQIGSGQHIKNGWLNSDINPLNGAIYLDATKRFPFDDCIFDYVYSEHMIEHISFPEGLKMLSECCRILKPEGIIRLATPDLLFLIELYRPRKSRLQNEYIKWATDMFIPDAISYEDTFVINNFVRDWGHKFIYDEKVLANALGKIGFANVLRRGINESEHEELRGLENEGRLPDGFLDLETMVLEAKKPVDS